MTSVYPMHKNISKDLDNLWSEWLRKWKLLITKNPNLPPSRSVEEISNQMQLVNPKYILREWMLAPAYQQAVEGNYELIRELQVIMTTPYSEQSNAVEDKYYKSRPSEISEIVELSHLNCSS